MSSGCDDVGWNTHEVHALVHRRPMLLYPLLDITIRHQRRDQVSLVEVVAEVVSDEGQDVGVRRFRPYNHLSCQSLWPSSASVIVDTVSATKPYICSSQRHDGVIRHEVLDGDLLDLSCGHLVVGDAHDAETTPSLSARSVNDERIDGYTVSSELTERIVLYRGVRSVGVG